MNRWQEPQDGWIPIGLSIFRFGIANGEAPAKRETLFYGAGYEPEPSTLEDLTELLQKHAGASKAEIDRENGRFLFSFTPSGAGAALHGGAPWSILWEPDESPKPNPQRDGFVNIDHQARFEGLVMVGDEEAAEGAQRLEGVRIATGLVWRQFMLRAFGRAIATGQVKLYASVPSPLNEFQKLPADVWPLLEVLNWELGIARDPQGTTYYRIHAVLAAPRTAQQKSTVADESAAAKALKAQLSLKPEMTRAEASSWLVSSGYRLGGRAFLQRVWPRARELASLPVQAPRGRKPKSKH